MARHACIVYAVFAYLVFLATFLYLIAFLGNAPWVPITVDRGASASPGIAALIDIALIGVFGIQHSVMARPAFKRAWLRVVPAPIERSTYVIFASAALILLFFFWRPIPALVWQFDQPIAKAIAWTTFALGWSIALLSTFLISHCELVGLRQVVLNWHGRGAAVPSLHQPFFYKLVRHPLYAGLLIAFWTTPAMSEGHVVFALAMSLYVVIGIQFEERDLIALFGERYADYSKRVGMLFPRFSKKTGQ